jgi:hypothetical protein
MAPRTGLVWKITEDGKNVAKASYSRYYEVMYTDEFSNIQRNTISTTNIPVVYSWLGDLNNNGQVENNELGGIKSQFVPRANSIDPNLRDPKNDEIMFAYQREVMSNVSFGVDWIQRWFNDQTVDQNCFGLPCASVTSAVYTPTRIVTDAGPDNILNTGNEQQVTYYDVAAAYRGKDTFLHTNCSNNVSVDCTQKYRAAEFTLTKRMSNRWQMQGSYVWSRLDGDIVLDYTDPNNLLPFVGQGRGANDQPHAFKLLGSYQAPLGITVGANYQTLSGLPRDRSLSVPFAQGTATVRVEPRGTYRADRLSLLSLRADKHFNLGRGHRASVIAELHNALNSSAGQSSFGVITRANATQAAFETARAAGTSYFGRVQEIVAPRVFKLGFRFNF